MMRLSVTVGAGRLEMPKGKLRAVMRAAGREVAAVARQLANGAGSGRMYYGSGGSSKYRGGYVRGRFQASSPGQSPARITGTLAQSIVVRPFKSGEGVAIRDTAFYSKFLEAGAKGGGRAGKRGVLLRRGQRKRLIGGARVLAPRPFLTRALDQREASIMPRIRQAITEDLKFVRVKP